MKFSIPFFLLLCIVALQSKAQYDNPITYEAGISLGPMNSLTDIGGRRGTGSKGTKDLNIKSTTFFGSIYGAAVFKNFLALRIEATAGSVKSNDSLLDGVKNTAIGRYNRNLSFRSPIYEISLIAEFHPIDFFRNFNSDSYIPRFSPYVMGGIGFFHFNPQAKLNDQWIDLRPLHTEGEGFAEYPASKEYQLNQINIPFGVGIGGQLSDKFNIRLEYLYRYLFTDYLDDTHDKYIDPNVFSKYLNGINLTNALILNNRRRDDAIPNETTARPGGIRGNPHNNDAYFTVNFKIGYVFGGERSSGGKNRNKQFKCPVFY